MWYGCVYMCVYGVSVHMWCMDVVYSMCICNVCGVRGVYVCVCLDVV